MIDGHKYWSEEITSRMVMCNYKNRRVYTYPNAPQNLYADLCDSAEKYPDNVAVVTDSGKKYTYREFLECVNKTAQFLHSREKVRKNDMVALMLYNTAEFCIAVYAVAKLGAVVVPINTKCRPKEWKGLLQKLPVRTALFDERLEQYREEAERDNPGVKFISVKDDAFAEYYIEDTGEEVYQESFWEDDVIIMFTSGTTGASKGVVLSNFNVGNAIASYEACLGITSADKTVIATPIYHITGLIALLGLFIHCGGTVYLHLQYRPERVLECCVKEHITLVHAAPTVFLMLLEKRKDYPKVPSVKQFACGSANMPPEAIRELKEWMPQMAFRTVYGLTESSSPATIFPEDAAGSKKIGSSGRPIPGLQMKLIDTDGKEVPEGESGELAIYGNVILDRYYDLKTEALTEDGWFRSGDIARFDSDGFVYIIDRKKDMINRGGEKIWSNEVENVLYDMEGVLEAAVIAIPDSKYGEVPMAVVRRENEKITEAGIKAWVKKRMAKFKVPEYVVFVDELPKTHNGKISKRTLREQYATFKDKRRLS